MFSRQRFTCALVLVCAFSGGAHAQPSPPPEKKPSEQKPSEQKPPEQKAPDQQPPAQKPPEEKPPAKAPAPPSGDEGAAEGGEGPARPAPRGKGVVWGLVVDERQESRS
jgi:hypothetical protein